MLKRTRTTNSEAIVNELELSKQLVDYSLIEGTILRQKYANYFQNFDYNNDYINSVNEASKKINIDDKLINEKFIVQFIPYTKSSYVSETFSVNSFNSANNCSFIGQPP